MNFKSGSHNFSTIM